MSPTICVTFVAKCVTKNFLKRAIWSHCSDELLLNGWTELNEIVRVDSVAVEKHLGGKYTCPVLIVDRDPLVLSDSPDYQKSPKLRHKGVQSPKPFRRFHMPSPNLDHHRSLQQLTEKISEIPKIIPLTWEKLST